MFPSVTQVLAPFSGIEELKLRFPHVLETAAARGTAVHGYCEDIAMGFPPVNVQTELSGYVESFQHWFAGVEEVLYLEYRLLDTHMGFHGQFDILCRMRGDKGLSLWDYKTPETFQSTWAAQIAAYRHLARINGIETVRGGTIRLRKTGRPPIINEYTSTERRDWSLFVSAFNVYTNLLCKRS